MVGSCCFKLCFWSSVLSRNYTRAVNSGYDLAINFKNKPERGNVMAIDFEIPAEAKAIREKVRQWVHDECIPAEKALDDKPLKEVLDPLRKKASAQGLWCPFIPTEYGGMG